MITRRWTSAALTLAGFTAGAMAQEPESPPEQPKPVVQEEEKEDDDTDLRDLNPFQPPAGGPEELQQLFLQVEKRLRRVTDLLYEASSGDMSSANDIGGAGIDELIREAEQGAAGASSGISRMLGATRAQGEATLEDIAKILELAEQQQGGGGGGGGGQSPPPPGSGQGQPQQGQTPSGSRKEEKGERPPQPGQQQQQGQQPSSQSDDPQGNQEQEGGPDGPAKAPPESETGDPNAANGNEDWGDLPIHLRKVFQNGVSDEVPPRYRDWVDSYFKELNRRSGDR
ncbi:MAG: hypothetical protein AAF726_03320 [Planctomycetota bacterium]